MRILIIAMAAAVLGSASVSSAALAGNYAPPKASVTPVEETRVYRKFLVTFPSPYRCAVPPNPTVYVHYYLPNKEGPFPVVMIVPHWGVVHLTPENELAGRLLRNGIAAAVYVLPYHLERTPPGFTSGTAFISGDVPRLVRASEQSLEEIKALTAWLRAQPDIEPECVGLAGISLGAIVAATALGKLREFKATALILGGADVADILWSSPIMMDERREWKRQGYTKAALAEALKPIAPLSYLEPSEHYNALMVNGLYDFVIPRRDTLALWRGLGKPPIVWVTSDHYIVGWVRRAINGVVTDYFLYNFGMRATFKPPKKIVVRRVKLGVFFDRGPFFAAGGSIDIIKPVLLPFTLEGQVSTAGFSVAAGIELSRHISLGVYRKLYPSDPRLLPYVMVYIVL